MVYKYGSGDGGITDITIKNRGSKHSDVVAFYGVLDELCAAINLAQVHVSDKERSDILESIINVIYKISANLYMNKETVVESGWLEALDVWVEQYREHTIKEFIKFNHPVPAQINLARTVCRRAELVYYSTELCVLRTNDKTGAYLNRLSSLLFHLAASFHNNSAIKEL